MKLRQLRSVFVSTVLASALVACGGGDDTKAKFDGDRISVLNFETTLREDPRLRDQAVRIVPAFRNSSWSNAGGFASNAAYHLELDGLGAGFQVDMVRGNEGLTVLKAPPVVADGKVFALGTDLNVAAVDAKTGAPLWTQSVLAQYTEPNFGLTRFFSKTEKPARALDGFGGGVAFAGGRLFVTTGFGEVLALNAENGEIIWRLQNLVPFSNAPTFSNGRIYVASQDSRLQAFNATDGTRIWEHLAIKEAATIVGATSVAVNDQVVVAGFNSGEVVALSPVNGQESWSETLTSRATQITPLSQLNAIVGRPVIDRDRVYVTSHGGRTAAIDLRSGQRVWTADVGSIETPWAMGDYVLIMSLDAELVSLSRDQGRVRWIAKLPAYENEEKRSGRIRWAGPVLASGKIILASSDGRLVEVDPTNGELGDFIAIEEPVSMPPVIADGILYVLSDEGTLIARK
jgi:outer membrane protein assembly factor BamB